MKKSLSIIISINILLVTLAVLLSYRMIAPRFEAKQASNLNSLGTLHTEAAAEKIASFVSLLKDELKENAIRLTDPSRGPIFLDPSRWLWMRLQDKEWRAQGYLEPLPLPRTDVDTWGLGQGKSSMVLSLRIPILKEGVQDFVMIEGGIKTTALNDLQNDNRFGLWVFDLNSYKKGGLSSAKIFELQSGAGLLSKEEIAGMTSDFFMKLFNSKESQELNASQSWQIYFKKSLSNDQLGILGFWAKDLEPQGLSSSWIILILALVVVSALSSFLIFKTLAQQPPELPPEEPSQPSPVRAEAGVPPPSPTPAPRLVQQKPAAVIPISKSFVNTSPPSPPPAPVENKSQSKQDIQRFIKGLCTDLGASLEGKAASSVDRILLFMEEKEPTFENFDLEIALHEFEKDENFSKIETFFDQDIWRVHSNSNYLKALFSLYTDFLAKNAANGERVRMSARYCSQDSIDVGCVDLKRSVFFKESFNRVILYVPAKEVFAKRRISEIFELSAATPKVENVEMPFSLDAIDHLHARLRMKSNAEEGHVIYLDIPVSEARRPEDIIFVKQLKGLIPDVPAPADSLPVIEEKIEEKVVVAEVPAPEIKVEEVAPPKEKSDEPVKALRLSEIERVSSFAEDISDERTRARSRFRIKKPGEKS